MRKKIPEMSRLGVFKKRAAQNGGKKGTPAHSPEDSSEKVSSRGEYLEGLRRRKLHEKG